MRSQGNDSAERGARRVGGWGLIGLVIAGFIAGLLILWLGLSPAHTGG